MLKPSDFFDLSKTKFAAIYEGCEFVWDALKRLPAFVEEALKPGIHGKVMNGAHVLSDDVFIGKGTVVEPGAVIKGPAIIGENCEIRKGAYLRGTVIVGDGAVVGNSCELKVALLHDGANVPHFAYVGDSLMGYKAHLGAGVKVSNVKLIREPVVVEVNGRKYNTGLIKFGAVVGDNCDIGCNSVLNPGSLIGPGSIMYTNVMWRGYVPPRSVVKMRQALEVVPRRDAK
jgi:NDP-sugar pyrophosphorylase family protein